MAQFHRIHVEITNICGLACSFCPPKSQAPKSMALSFFEDVLVQLRSHTKTLALHVMGDPLTLSTLHTYLECALKYGFEVELTTSGYYLKNHSLQTLFHPCVRQLNISLNAFNKNSLGISFEEYMQHVLYVSDEKLANYPKPFINLRLWNLDGQQSEQNYNTKIFELLGSHFEVEVNDKNLDGSREALRLASKVLLHFDSYFEWPTLSSSHMSHGKCYGLKAHIAILADGRVVPCCLDGDGVIELGNLHEKSLEEILHSKRAVDIKEGFVKGIAVEDLCQKCSYKDRF
jgi:radical SAM protein with 4Fe4S-binding SPASM domain